MSAEFCVQLSPELVNQ